MAVPHRLCKAIRNSPYVRIAVTLHAGMAAIGHGESSGESHHDINRECRGDPADHRRAEASLGIERRFTRWDPPLTPPWLDHRTIWTRSSSGWVVKSCTET